MAKTAEHISFIFIFCFININVGVRSLNIVSDKYMQSGKFGHCGETVIPEDSIVVKSHIGFGFMNYGINQDCTIHFRTLAGYKMLVKFMKFELEEAVNGVCNDYVTLSDTQTETLESNSTSDMDNNGTIFCNGNMDNFTLCVNGTLENSTNPSVSCNGTLLENGTEANTTSCNNTTLTAEQKGTNIPKLCGTRTGEFVVSENNVTTIAFVTNGAIEGNGYKLLVTIFHEENCTDEEFRCDTTRCISKALRCDSVKHCVDQSDEDKTKAGCSIVDIFTSLGQTSILAIVIVASAILFTIFISIMLWQFKRQRKIGVLTLKRDDESHIHAKSQSNEQTSERTEDHKRNDHPKDQAVERADYHSRNGQTNDQDLKRTEHHNREDPPKDQVFERTDYHNREGQINDQAFETAKNHKREKSSKDQAFERAEYHSREDLPKDQAVEVAELNSRKSPPKDQAFERVEGQTKKQGFERAEYKKNVQYKPKNRANVSTPVAKGPPRVENVRRGTTDNRKRSSMPPVEETNVKARSRIQRTVNPQLLGDKKKIKKNLK